jgi:FkbM family methyltransferase
MPDWKGTVTTYASPVEVETGVECPFPEDAALDTVFRFAVHELALEIPRALLAPDLWRALVHQYYEGSELAALQAVVRQNDTILEIGGGIGYISTHILKRFGGARVTILEADPRLIPIIHRTHALNSVVADEVLNLVAARHDGTVTFNQQPSFWASSIVDLPGSRQLTLPACDLEAIVGKVKPDVLIVDIEGGERDLFDGLVLSCVRQLIVEVHRPQIGLAGVAACVSHLADAGFTYDPNGSTGSNVVFSRFQ